MLLRHLLMIYIYISFIMRLARKNQKVESCRINGFEKEATWQLATRRSESEPTITLKYDP